MGLSTQFPLESETVEVLESLVEDDADETVRTAARETLSRIRD
ncbi:hypothetical protein SAMN05216559_1913 [Halomicrobium zhouii]|uniref:HEAT repeat-containing protein n=1 Tax=Halomicrobium zhouii TaxID=767519 RepID=A0A1I6L2P2_9EURY|nr:hypothetical protein SAMN05216559_1913 [Halomicrobium zhouii]